MSQLTDVIYNTVETVSMSIVDGPILSPFSWDRNRAVRRQIVGATAKRQRYDGQLMKWRVDLRYRKVKKDGDFAAVGAGSLGAWSYDEWSRPEIAECLLMVCDRVGIAACELYTFADIVQDARDKTEEQAR